MPRLEGLEDRSSPTSLFIGGQANLAPPPQITQSEAPYRSIGELCKELDRAPRTDRAPLQLVSFTPPPPNDGHVPKQEKIEDPSAAQTFLSQRFSTDNSDPFADQKPRRPNTLSTTQLPSRGNGNTLNPQALAGSGGGGAGGRSTPNAGMGGGGPTGGGGGPGIVNANQFLGDNFGVSSGNAGSNGTPSTPSNLPSSSTPPSNEHAPSSPLTDFQTSYAMTPPAHPALTPHGNGHKSGGDPLYVLDVNTGETVPANTTLNTFSTWSENLLAQVSGATVASYSWDLSQAPDLTNVSGTTTANLQGTWANFTGTARSDTISVTETPQSGAALTQTITFEVAGTNSPAYSSTRPTSSSTWPSVLTPDKLSSGQAMQAAGPYASIGLADGSVQTAFAMPSYNPNTTPAGLVYNSTAANAQPIFLTEYQLPLGQAVPSTITAQLTFNNTALATVTYSTAALNPGDIVQIALQANATGLSTGRYPWSITVTNGSTPTTYSGNVDIVNRANSPYGAGWSLDNVEQLVSVSGGMMLVNPDGTSLFFASNGQGGFTTPAGDFSTLVQNANGTYTRTLTDGTQINFNSSGQQTSLVDRDGNTTSFAYTNGLLTSITDMNGQATSLSYTNGLLTSIADPANRSAALGYTGSQLTSITDAGNNLWQYGYDSANDLTSLTDPNTHATTFTYNFADRVSSVTRADSSTEKLTAMQMNGRAAPGTGTPSNPATALLLAAGDQAQFTDPNSNVWTTGLDWLGFGLPVLAADPLGDTALVYRDTNGLPWMSADPLGRGTREFFNSQGDATEIVQADDSYSQYQYNNFSEVTQYTDPTGDVTSYTFNNKGDLTEKTDALLHNTTFAYNNAGLVTSTTDALNHVTTYAYNALNELTSETNALNQTTTFAYVNAGLVSSTTDPMGYVTTYAYDALDRLTGETLPDSSTIFSVYSYGYDKVGNRTSVTDPLNHVTTYNYNALNELTSETNALNETTTFGYDGDGNQTTVTNPLLETTTYGYNAANELTGLTNALNETTTFGYDAAGEKISETNPLNQTTTYGYTVMGQVASVTDPLSDVISYTYDAAGDGLTMSQSGPGINAYTTKMVYNAVHEETSYTDPLNNEYQYQYDAVGNRTSVIDPLNHTTSYGYNAIYELTSVTDALNETTSYGYNADGQRTSVTDPLNHVTSYSSDAQGRTLTETAPNGGETTYKYDVAGNLLSLTDPDNNTTSYGYDAISELVSKTNPLNYQTTYAYNAGGLLTSTTDADGRTIDYGYNAVGQVTSETWVGGNYVATYVIVHKSS
jgi:YD repeat-containing protein